jgi:uncharacterized OsmC-like protein
LAQLGAAQDETSRVSFSFVFGIQRAPSPDIAMPEQTPLEYTVTAYRLDAHGSLAKCKEAEVALDTDVAGRADAFNPAGLLLAALAACMIKGIERVAPMLKFQYRGVQVNLRGARQDAPPKMSHIGYEITVDTDELDQRLKLLHANVRKYGTVFNTVAPGTEMTGTLHRAGIAETPTPHRSAREPASNR